MSGKSQKADNKQHKNKDLHEHKHTKGDKKTPPRFESLKGEPIE